MHGCLPSPFDRLLRQSSAVTRTATSRNTLTWARLSRVRTGALSILSILDSDARSAITHRTWRVLIAMRRPRWIDQPVSPSLSPREWHDSPDPSPIFPQRYPLLFAIVLTESVGADHESGALVFRDLITKASRIAAMPPYIIRHDQESPGSPSQGEPLQPTFELGNKMLLIIELHGGICTRQAVTTMR